MPHHGRDDDRPRDARVVLLSRRAADHRVWLASQYEFEDVVAEIDDVVLLSPRRRDHSSLGRVVHHGVNRLGRPLGRGRRAPLLPVGESVDTDLFFGVFAAPHELGALPLVGAQVARARRRVAFIIELWTSQVGPNRDYLSHLRGFDHIFLFSRWAAPAVEEITGVPTTYLPTGVDALRFSPLAPGPSRSIDVISYGRRLDGTHRPLVDAAARGLLHYDFDTIAGAFDVTGHVEHRLALAARLQRSRYAVVYKNNDVTERLSKTAGEDSLTNRYFEALAAGAVVLGSVPDTPDAAAQLGWTDAIVPIPAPAPQVVELIRGLDRDQERLELARRTAIRESLLRHDWSHRWREVLAVAGLGPAGGFTARESLLAERAEGLDRLAGGE